MTGSDEHRTDWTVPDRESVLITGPSEHTLDGVVRRLVERRAGQAGGLVVTTRDGAVTLTTETGGPLDAFADGVAGIVDCTPGDAAGVDRDELLWRVGSPTEFTGIGMAISAGLDALAARGVDTPWVVFDSLSTLFVSADSNDVIRFAHAVHSQVTARGGVCLFPVYTNVTTGTDLERCKHLATVHAAVRRREGCRQVRLRGLPGGPRGWVPLDRRRDGLAVTAAGDLRAP